MQLVENIIPLFYDGQGWNAVSISTLCFRVGMLISCGVFVFSALAYLKKYKIFQIVLSKISGNVREYDRIRRAQMREELESRRESSDRKKKESLLTKLYAVVSQTGIMEKVPGFSEVGFLVIIGVIALALLILTTIKRGAIVGIAAFISFLVIVWYSLSLIAYNRKMKLEGQLLEFINTCASASTQYAGIIDIFGAVYDQFTAPLREGLESCYIEAKQTSNKELALKHLKEKYSSAQFAFVLDNLTACSSATGNYYDVAKDISEVISVYCVSHEKKRVSLRNAKVRLTVMFFISLGILYALSLFLGGLKETLFHTSIGNITLIAMGMLYFYGLNIKAEK